MSADETKSVLDLLVSQTLSDADGAALLSSWAERGETGSELCATVRYLRERAVTVPAPFASFDLCGTGGSGQERYNVSTTVAFIAAAAGIPVAKHGNRGSRRPNGSFDLLEALDVPFGLGVEQNVELLTETGVCFLFARAHHPTVGKVARYRQAVGRRTIFNLAGPLANPAPLKHQLIGTTQSTTGRVIASALQELHTVGAFVVWGDPFIDEISVTGNTGVLHVTPNKMTETTFHTPSHPELDYMALPHGDAVQNKETFFQLLGGTLTGPLFDMVCTNAGAAIDLWEGRAPDYCGPGALRARELVHSGRALEIFHKHRDLAKKLGR